MKNGAERRQHPRVPLALEVILTTPQGPIKGKTANVSVTGLAILFFLEKPEIGHQFEIILKSPEDHELSLTCEKFWSDEFISNEIVYYVIGVEFTKVSPNDREIIAALVEKYYKP